MTRPDLLPSFDKADGYEQAVPFFATFGERLMDLLIREPGWDLLDIGTGHGSVASAAAARGFTVTATDSTPRLVADLRLQNRDINAVLMSAHSLDFKNDSFDIVTASFVIDLFDDATPVLHEVCRVVRPGGLVAVTVPARASAAGPRRAHAQAPVDVAEVFAKAGLTDLREEGIEVRMPVPSGQGFVHHRAKIHLGRLPRTTASRA